MELETCVDLAIRLVTTPDVDIDKLIEGVDNVNAEVVDTVGEAMTA